MTHSANTKWFKAKNYGWGWYPATWQGWVVLIIFLIITIADFRLRDARSHSASDTLINFLPDVIILTLTLIAICYATGEKPTWRWGGKKLR